MASSSPGLLTEPMDDEYEFRALRPQGAEPVRCVLPSRFVLASFQAPSESRSCALIVGRNWSTSSWRAESVLEAFANAVTIVPNRTAPDKSATGTSRWIHPPGSICSLRRRRPQPRRGCGVQSTNSISSQAGNSPPKTPSEITPEICCCQPMLRNVLEGNLQRSANIRRMPSCSPAASRRK